MSINERIEKQLNGHDVLLYMKGTPYFPQCGFSSKAVQMLQACEAEFAYVNIFDDEEIRAGLKVYSNWPTFPQLYVKGELVGGADIMIEMFENGELKEALDNVKASS
jgi:monothiol glutaredoxin